MKRLCVAALVALVGCSPGPAEAEGAAGKNGADGMRGANGSNGSDGANGMNGMNGSDAPVVKAIVSAAPASVTVGFGVDVFITGNNVRWTALTRPDFGADVTVSNVTVLSPSALKVHVAVAAGATAGPRTISILDGAETLTFHGFDVLPRVQWTMQGTQRPNTFMKVGLRVNVPGFSFGEAYLRGACNATQVSTSIEGGEYQTLLFFPGDVTAPQHCDVWVVDRPATPLVQTFVHATGFDLSQATNAGSLTGAVTDVTFAQPFDTVTLVAQSQPAGTVFKLGADGGQPLMTAAERLSAPVRALLAPPVEVSQFTTLLVFDAEGRGGSAEIRATSTSIAATGGADLLNAQNLALDSSVVGEAITGMYFRITMPPDAAGRRLALAVVRDANQPIAHTVSLLSANGVETSQPAFFVDFPELPQFVARRWVDSMLLPTNEPVYLKINGGSFENPDGGDYLFSNRYRLTTTLE